MLPWTAFALAFAAMYARMIRASVLDILNEDYVRTARAKGLGDWPILKTHVLRNAMLPIVTMIGMDMSALAFAPTVFVERVFGLPGIGNLLFVSLQRHDLPVIVGIVVVVTTAILFFNLVVDLLYGVLDPRIRLTSQLKLPRLAVVARGRRTTYLGRPLGRPRRAGPRRTRRCRSTARRGCRRSPW